MQTQSSSGHFQKTLTHFVKGQFGGEELVKNAETPNDHNPIDSVEWATIIGFKTGTQNENLHVF